jgi:hypothetical protein
MRLCFYCERLEAKEPDHDPIFCSSGCAIDQAVNYVQDRYQYCDYGGHWVMTEDYVEDNEICYDCGVERGDSDDGDD